MYIGRVGAAGVVASAVIFACDGRIEAPSTTRAPDDASLDGSSGPADLDAASPSDAEAGLDAGASAFTWSTLAPLTVPRTDLGAAVIDGKIYAIGGYSGSLLSRVDAYDPATHAWERRADLHTARRSFAVGAIDGKIYVAAGMAFTDYNAVTWLTSTEVFNPAANTWTERAPCPIATDGNNVWGNRFVGGGVMNGLLYVVAFDANSTTMRNAMYVYDPVGDTWSTNKAGAFGSAQFGAATLGSQLYVYASPYFDPPPGQLWSWEPSSETWIIRGTLPPWKAAFLSFAGKLYTFGGVTGTAGEPVLSNAVNEYDPATAKWTQRGAISVARESAAAVETGGHVYVIGGTVGLVPSDVVEEGTPP